MELLSYRRVHPLIFNSQHIRQFTIMFQLNYEDFEDNNPFPRQRAQEKDYYFGGSDSTEINTDTFPAKNTKIEQQQQKPETEFHKFFKTSFVSSKNKKLKINVGFGSAREEYSGIAHYLEHMIAVYFISYTYFTLPNAQTLDFATSYFFELAEDQDAQQVVKQFFNIPFDQLSSKEYRNQMQRVDSEGLWKIGIEEWWLALWHLRFCTENNQIPHSDTVGRQKTFKMDTEQWKNYSKEIYGKYYVPQNSSVTFYGSKKDYDEFLNFGLDSWALNVVSVKQQYKEHCKELWARGQWANNILFPNIPNKGKILIMDEVMYKSVYFVAFIQFSKAALEKLQLFAILIELFIRPQYVISAGKNIDYGFFLDDEVYNPHIVFCFEGQVKSDRLALVYQMIAFITNFGDYYAKIFDKVQTLNANIHRLKKSKIIQDLLGRIDTNQWLQAKNMCNFDVGRSNGNCNYHGVNHHITQLKNINVSDNCGIDSLSFGPMTWGENDAKNANFGADTNFGDWARMKSNLNDKENEKTNDEDEEESNDSDDDSNEDNNNNDDNNPLNANSTQENQNQSQDQQQSQNNQQQESFSFTENTGLEIQQLLSNFSIYAGSETPKQSKEQSELTLLNVKYQNIDDKQLRVATSKNLETFDNFCIQNNVIVQPLLKLYDLELGPVTSSVQHVLLLAVTSQNPQIFTFITTQVFQYFSNFQKIVKFQIKMHPKVKNSFIFSGSEDIQHFFIMKFIHILFHSMKAIAEMFDGKTELKQRNVMSIIRDFLTVDIVADITDDKYSSSNKPLFQLCVMEKGQVMQNCKLFCNSKKRTKLINKIYSDLSKDLNQNYFLDPEKQQEVNYSQNLYKILEQIKNQFGNKSFLGGTNKKINIGDGKNKKQQNKNNKKKDATEKTNDTTNSNSAESNSTKAQQTISSAIKTINLWDNQESFIVYDSNSEFKVQFLMFIDENQLGYENVVQAYFFLMDTMSFQMDVNDEYYYSSAYCVFGAQIMIVFEYRLNQSSNQTKVLNDFKKKIVAPMFKKFVIIMPRQFMDDEVSVNDLVKQIE